MESRGYRLLAALMVLVTATIAVLIFEDRAFSRRQERRADFPHLVGGLGFGPALELSPCAFGFDPRLDGSCELDCGPVPGGACFCPRHAGSIFYFRPLHQEQPFPDPGAMDAPAP